MSKNPRTSESGRIPMTRRELLLRMGVVGSSSFAFGAMNALELLGAPIRPRPVLSGSPQQQVRVIVLGAGVAGLVTAYELNKRGYDCRVLEARDRVGGLAWTVSRGSTHTELGAGGETQVCNFDEGQYFNAGPWRIPHTHHGMLGYYRELGVRLEPFLNDDLVMFNEDPRLGELANKKVYLRELRADLWGQTSELLAKAVDQGSLDRLVNAEDKERLIEFLVEAGYLDDADLIYSPDAELRGSEGRYDLSLLLHSPFANRVRSINSGTGGPDPLFQPMGGMMQLPLAFQRVLGDRLTLRAEVVSVRQTEGEVRVVYEDTRRKERHELVGAYVVCCLPMSIVKKLDINFSPEMAAAIQRSGHSNSSKMGLQMARRFWEQDDGIYGGHLRYEPYSGGSSGPTPLPQFSYPSNDLGSKKGVLLGYYGNGELPGLDGRPLVESSVAARVEHVLTHASKVHPQMRQEFESAYCVWWPRVPYSEGAWARNPGDDMAQLGQADGRLYVGHSGAGSHPSWQEGAVESAWHAVETLHERAMRG
jgi:monoamine oxidase